MNLPWYPTAPPGTLFKFSAERLFSLTSVSRVDDMCTGEQSLAAAVEARQLAVPSPSPPFGWPGGTCVSCNRRDGDPKGQKYRTPNSC